MFHFSLSKRHFVGVCLSTMFFLLLSFKGKAQVVLSLSYQPSTSSQTSELAGNYWTMQLNYSVSSTTGSANGVKITIPLPDEIDDAAAVTGTSHAPTSNFVFSNVTGAKKMTINFVNPVASGSTGVLEFKMRTRNGTVPNGTVIRTCATLTESGGATSADKCNDMSIIAGQMFCGFKTLKFGKAIGYPITYRIALAQNKEFPTSINLGSLNLSNISITDTYPAGATFIEAKVVNSAGTTIPSTITNGANSVTATLPDFNITTGSGASWITTPYFLDVTLQYDSPTFDTTTPITNTASITFTPVGMSPVTLTDGSTTTNCTSDLIETHTLQVPSANATLTKLAGGVPSFSVNSGGAVGYFVGVNNSGSIPLENVEVIENIPAELTLSNVLFNSWANEITAIQYITNQNSTWTNWALGNGSNYINPPALAQGEKITKLKLIIISPFNAGASLSGTNMINFVANSVPSSTVVSNCLEWNSTTAGLPTNRTLCNSQYTVNPAATTSKVWYTSFHSPGCQASYVTGQTLTIQGRVRAETGFADIENPTAAFYVPSGFNYVPNSESFNPRTSGITASPTLTITKNHLSMSGTSYDLYHWVFPVGTVLPVSNDFDVLVKVTITNSIPAGVIQPLRFVADASNSSEKVSEAIYDYVFTDTNDWDGDSNTTEQFRVAGTANYSCNVIVAASVAMESLKWVKGLCDTTFSRYPQFGLTVPGGNADYKLIIKNTGNVVMKDIKIIDILPYIGDKGVIDPSARSTQWKPNLADSISAPAGIMVYYSTVSNPCRDEVKQPSDPSPFPTGCTTANWSLNPPADITKVQSIKIDFGTTTLAGGDSLVFSWPMRAPINAPTNNEIAWNSFAFVATRTDNNQAILAAEPIKVGIKVKNGIPAFYGDKVWFDSNHNGIQDATEGGVDGIKVKLFKTTSLTATPNPNTDELVNFSITGNGGYYRFSNLQAGFYYAVFCLSNGYSISPKNAAGSTSENDSDGNTSTYMGELATITPITELTANEDDPTWDQGIYCSISPSVTLSQSVPLGGSATYTATGGTNYLWTGPNGFNATTSTVTISNVSAADTGAYIVNVDNGVCYASLSTSLSITTCTKPIVSITPKTQTVCQGKQPSSLTASGTPTTGIKYYWYGPITDTTSNLGAVKDSSTTFIIPTQTTSGTYYYAVVAYGSSTTCTDTAFAIINVNPKPYAGSNISLPCVNGLPATNTTLAATPIAGGQWSALASNPSGATITSPSNANSSVTGLLPGTYNFVWSAATCTDTVTVIVIQCICVQPSNVTITATSATCIGSNTQNDAKVSITANNADKFGYSIGNSYTGTPYASTTGIIVNNLGAINGLTNPTSPQVYTIRLFNGNDNCYRDETVTIQPVVCQTPCGTPNCLPISVMKN